MRLKKVLVYASLLVAGTARTVSGCVCSGQVLNDREDAASQFAGATVVFEGEVLPGGREIATPTRDKPGLGMIVFQVLRSYKGELGKVIRLYDAEAGTDCSFGQPKPGERFFVYGFQRQDGRIYLEACTRTGPWESAGPDIRYARAEPATKEDLTPPGEKWRLEDDPSLAKSGATLRGVVRRSDGAGIGSVFVNVWDVDGSGRRENSMAATQKANEDGTYEIRYLPPGRYRVTAADYQMSPTARLVGESANVSLKKGQTVSHVDVMLQPEQLGKVRVQVTAPPEIHDRVIVWLRDTEMDSTYGSPYPYAQTAHLDTKNVASFEFVPYGLYDVYVMLTGEDVGRPSWTHNEVRVRLNGSDVETVVELRKAKKNQ